jgi:hypothetical protein
LSERQASADEGVVVIGIAQEHMNAFAARKVVGQTGRVSFDFSRRSVGRRQPRVFLGP